MKTFIKSSAAIAGVNLFEEKSHSRPQLSEGGVINALEPDYSRYIQPRAQRRMGKLLKMSVATAFKSLEEAGIDIPEAIVVGTGLGCLNETEKFLDEIIVNEEGLLSPTSFIQSTHNTIAGQISLLKKCYGYNYTYSDRDNSFENALLDASMLIEEGHKNVLLGAADEITEMALNVMTANGCLLSKTGDKIFRQGEGAAFFTLVGEMTDVEFKATLKCNDGQLKESMSSWTEDQNIDLKNTLCYSLNPGSLSNIEGWGPTVDFSFIAGIYFTAMAIGMYLGHDYLTSQKHIDIIEEKPSRNFKSVLIHNGGIFGDHSFILLCRS